jgi:hypothetical protein
LAQQLGAVLEGASERQTRLFKALKPLDEGWKVQTSQDNVAPVIEACLVGCHEGKRQMYVHEVCELTKTILLARNERITPTPKSIGVLLRENVGVVTQRAGPGYRLLLDTATCQRIHDVGKAHGVLSLAEPHTDCAFCSAAFGGKSKK